MRWVRQVRQVRRYGGERAAGAHLVNVRVCSAQSVSNSVLAIELGGVGLILLVASVFLVTFAVVIGVAYFLIGAKNAGPISTPASDVDTSLAAPAASETVPTPAVAADQAGPPEPSDPTRQSPAVRIRLPRVSGILAAISTRMRQRRLPRTSLTEAETMKALEMVRDGLPLSEAARVAYPDFDRLEETAKRNIETRLQQLARSDKPD